MFCAKALRVQTATPKVAQNLGETGGFGRRGGSGGGAVREAGRFGRRGSSGGGAEGGRAISRKCGGKTLPTVI